MGGILEVASVGGILKLIVRSREIHLSRRPPSEGLLGQVGVGGGTTLYPPQSLTPSTVPSEAHWLLR